MRLLLIGFSGCGKSSLAALLGVELDLSVRDMDTLIITASGRASISEIFDRDGEPRFRELEAQIAKELAGEQNVVISAGGGVVEYEQTMRALATPATTTIYLQTSFAEIRERLKGDTTRPLMRDLKKAEALFLKRLPLYEKHADLVVHVEGRSFEEIIKDILGRLEER